MGYKKSDITAFAKICAKGQDTFSLANCYAQEIVHSEMGRELVHIGNEELLFEVAKRYAKYAQSESSFDVETGETQEFQDLIDKIVEICEENDWFN